MAVENEFKHSKDLFKNADGSGMVFFMRPCNQRQELRPLIEYGGGKVTSKVLKDSTKLAEKGSMVSGDDYIAATFIEDCLKQNKLLPMDTYRVKPGTRVRSSSGDSNITITSFSSSDSMSPASYIVQTTARDCKGRSKYTKEEDIAMITFLMEEKRYSEALGLRVWKDMELRKITKHSASSMNTRYRKHILPNIETYKYDVDRRWLSKLTGGSVVKEKEPEFSADALFATPLKRNKPESTPRKVDLTGEFGDVFDFTMTDEDSQKEEENEREIQKVNGKKSNVDQEALGNEEVNDKGEESKKDRGDTKHEYIENLKAITKEYSKYVRKGTNCKDNKTEKPSVGELGRETATYQEHSKDAINDKEHNEGKPNCEKSSNSEKNCEKHCKENMCHAYAVDEVLDKISENEINSEKGKLDQTFEKVTEKDKHPTERKGKGECVTETTSKIHSKKVQNDETAEGKGKNHHKSDVDANNDQEKMEELDLDTNVPSPPDIFQMTDDDSAEFEENDKDDKNEVIKMDDGRLALSQESGENESSDLEFDAEVPCVLRNGKRKADYVDKGISASKRRHKDSSGKCNERTEAWVRKVSNGTQVSSNAETQPPEVIELCSNEVTSSGQLCEIENSDESGGLEILNDSDSFDEMLKSYINRKKNTMIDMTSEDGNGVIVDDNDDVSINNSSKRQLRREERNLRKRQNEKDNAEISSSRDEKKRKLVAECKAKIQTIANKYDISEGFVRKLLFQCSNDVDRAVSYIEYGPHSPDLPPWTDSDDKALERNRKAVGLVCKFGLEDLMNRYNFMNYIS